MAVRARRWPTHRRLRRSAPRVRRRQRDARLFPGVSREHPARSGRDPRRDREQPQVDRHLSSNEAAGYSRSLDPHAPAEPRTPRCASAAEAPEKLAASLEIETRLGNVNGHRWSAAHYGLALGYLGRFDEAEAVLKPVVQADEPTWSRARVNALWRLGTVLRLQGDSQGALSRLEQALAHTSKRPRSELDRGEILAEIGQARADLGLNGAAIESRHGGTRAPAAHTTAGDSGSGGCACRDRTRKSRPGPALPRPWYRRAGGCLLARVRCRESLGGRGGAVARSLLPCARPAPGRGCGARARGVDPPRSPLPADTRLVKLARSR